MPKVMDDAEGAKGLKNFITTFVHKRLELMTDGEPALVDVAKKVKELSTVPIFLKNIFMVLLVMKYVQKVQLQMMMLLNARVVMLVVLFANLKIQKYVEVVRIDEVIVHVNVRKKLIARIITLQE